MFILQSLKQISAFSPTPYFNTLQLNSMKTLQNQSSLENQMLTGRGSLSENLSMRLSLYRDYFHAVNCNSESFVLIYILYSDALKLFTSLSWYPSALLIFL